MCDWCDGIIGGGDLMDLKKKRVLVIGMGLSGIAATNLLTEKGAWVVLYDDREIDNQEEIKRKLTTPEKVEIATGNLKRRERESFELVVLSPGVPLDTPLVEDLKRLHLPILGEVELAYLFGKGEVLAITGTNGKTTTTTLLGEILKQHFSKVFVVGNIGKPYTEVVGELTEDSVIVAEISSFQLETIETFRPKVSGILNITPDHLNRHHTMEAYFKAKESITKNQTSEDVCVLNYEDDYTRSLGKYINAKVIYFSSKRKLQGGVYLDQGAIYFGDEEVCKLSELQVLGVHNYENVMAAVAMARAYEVPMDVIRNVVISFKGVPHRIEYVETKQKVVYYNDSKGTNPDAAIKGIQAMNRPTILIGGGYDKDSDYREWIANFEGKVKKLILFGETKEKIKKAALDLGFQEVELVKDLEEAVQLSFALAREGDAVLLSPACASWDMYPNFEARGEHFKELVAKL